MLCHFARWDVVAGMGFATRYAVIEDSAEKIAGYNGVEFDLDLFTAMKLFEARIVAEDGRQRKAKEESDRLEREREQEEKRAAREAEGYGFGG